MERYQILSEVALVGDEVASRIDEAKAVLRDPQQFYDYERYMWLRARSSRACASLAEFWPTRLTPHGFVTRYRVEQSREIVAALDDERANPFIEYFHETRCRACNGSTRT